MGGVNGWGLMCFDSFYLVCVGTTIIIIIIHNYTEYNFFAFEDNI